MKYLIALLVLIISVFSADHDLFMSTYPLYGSYYRPTRIIRRTYIRPLYGSYYNPYYSSIW